MIKNWMLAGIAGLVAACGGKDVTAGRYQGMVEIEQVDVAFEIGGRVVARAVEPGQAVEKGQVLARVDDVIDAEARAIQAKDVEVAKADLAVLEAGSRPEDVRAARAQLAAAVTGEQVLGKQLNREKGLVASGAVAGAYVDDLEAQLAKAKGERQALDERVRLLSRGARVEELARARARVALAEESLALADKKLAMHVLVAPVAGTVLDVYPEVGEVIAPGAPFASLIDRARPYADVFVPVADAPRLQIGAPMRVTVEGVAGELGGTVERVAPHAEFTPRFVYSPRERPNLMVRVRVRLADPEGRLHAGLPVYARPAEVAVAGARP